MKTILALILAWLFAAPAFAIPNLTGEPERLLTATAATATQNTAEFVLPAGYSGLHCVLAVTAGTTLLIDFNLQARDSVATWTNMVADIPTASGITGTGSTFRLFYPHAISGAAISNFGISQVSVPHVFRFQVQHNNANAATYTLDCGAMQ